MPREPNVRFPAWQGVYEATLRESKIDKLFKLVEIAEAAMLTRRDLLKHNSGSRAERHAIEDGLRILLVIKQGQLQFSSVTDKRGVRNAGSPAASQ